MYAAPEQVQKVKDHLRARIFRGELAEGTRILEEEVREQTHSSVRAVKWALQDLAREGLVQRKRRVGTFVSATLPSAVYAVLPRVHSVGILSSLSQAELGGTFFTQQLMAGIRSSLHPPALVTTIANQWSRPINDPPQVDAGLLKNTLQGLIGIEANNAEVLNELVRASMPVVAVDFSVSGHQFDVIEVDYQEAGYLATAHLLGMGHRRIAYVGEAMNPQSPDPAWQDRLTGYLRAMAGGPGEMPQPLILDAQRTPAQVRSLLHPFHVRHRPTAYVAASFGFAREIAQIMDAKGMAWPKDYSLACADGAFSLGGFPELSCALCDYERVGRETIRLLASRLACPLMPPVRHTVPVSFRGRESCAPPPEDSRAVAPR